MKDIVQGVWKKSETLRSDSTCRNKMKIKNDKITLKILYTSYCSLEIHLKNIKNDRLMLLATHRHQMFHDVGSDQQYRGHLERPT